MNKFTTVSRCWEKQKSAYVSSSCHEELKIDNNLFSRHTLLENVDGMLNIFQAFANNFRVRFCLETPILKRLWHKVVPNCPGYMLMRVLGNSNSDY